MALALCCFAINACHDDTFDMYLPDNVDGNGELTFVVDMPSMNVAELSSRGTAGDAINSIDTNGSSLHIFIYNADGNYLYDCGVEGLSEFNYSKDGNDVSLKYPYGELDADNTTSSGYETSQGEAKTPRATFKLKNYDLQDGATYQIYVSANFAVPADKSEFDTAEKLKAYTVAWDINNPGKNAQMFGMFSDEKSCVEGGPFTYSRTRTSLLHAWLIRCASKVTVDFCTKELNDNTWIYLYDVTIHNVPQKCHLRDRNAAGADYNVHAIGENIVYAPEGSDYSQAETQFTNWPVLTRSTTNYGSDHSETAEALYFYENLQGTGKDKSQIDSGKEDGKDDEVSWPDGTTQGKPGWRDEKEYGTYIEVQAYYRSFVRGNEGEGRIVYRFMLGMDTFKDYNAYRNHHFKLTLNFRGNANDVDWHIDYTPNTESVIYVPQPLYISYLYGENVEMPVTIDGKLTEGTKVIAEIVENNWKPLNAPPSVYWNGDVWSGNNVKFDGPWHGFLSLRPTNSIENRHTTGTIPNSDAIGRDEGDKLKISDKAYLMSYWFGGSENMHEFKDVVPASELYSSSVIDQNEGMHVPPQGYREFETTNRSGRTTDNTKDNVDSYEILESTNGGRITTHMYLPLYTRALFMVKAKGWAGANPYFTYQRKAVVKITCWVDKIINNVTQSVKYTKFCDVIQVRRLINPSGIYREAGNNKPFTVQLCFRTSEKAATFMPFVSDGKWSAEIESGDAGFITLNGLQKVQGRTGEYVTFRVAFAPTTAKRNRHAVILVKYHDLTCKHRIMVRQGYDPEALYEGGVKWHCFNLRGGERETDSPIEAGSLFRFGNYFYGIDASNNTTDQYAVAPPAKFNVTGLNGKIAGTASWTDTWQYTLNPTSPTLEFQRCENLDAATVNFRRYFTLKNDAGEVTNSNDKTRLANYEDWSQLRDKQDCIYNTGVCYDGTADATALTAEKAFTYMYANPDRAGSGMRGMFVYNRVTGKNVFYPVGASGYGRRKRQGTYKGMLRYANRDVFMPADAVYKLPMFWNIKDNLGAIYWGYPDDKDRVDVWSGDGNTPSVPNFNAWDMNVSTFDFNHFSENAYTRKTSDAAFMRLVDE